MKAVWLVVAVVLLMAAIRLVVWLGEVLWEGRYRRWKVGDAVGLGLLMGVILGALGWLALGLVRLGA